MEYKKRAGTSGISGQLYETKLISLFLFRLLHDDRVQDFYLASNMDEIGTFDDICLHIKIEGQDRPIMLFVQVKHKDNDDRFLTLDNSTDLVKWFDSILKIKEKVTSRKDTDKLFSGNINETDFVFILYTNARFAFDFNAKFVSSYATILNNLIATSDTVGCRPQYSEQHIEDFGRKLLEKDLISLVEHFVAFLNDNPNQSMNIMNDTYIQQYHVILKQYVVEVSETRTEVTQAALKYRILRFCDDFFNSDDRHVALFRHQLMQEILKMHPRLRHNENDVGKLISSFIAHPSVVTLTPLIITHITCNEQGELQFVIKRPPNEIEQLRQVQIASSAVNESAHAATSAAVKYLQSLELKVPVTFGNMDLAISGSPKKIDRRLTYLAQAIVELCKQYKKDKWYKIVTIDDTIDGGLLNLSGGLASAVGNILCYEMDTKLLKFSNDVTSLHDNAKALFLKLTAGLSNMFEYRFDIKTTKFPKPYFDCTNVARDFLSKFIIYEKQRNHHEVEELFKKEIDDYQASISADIAVKPDLVFLYYHNEIQKWWMSTKIGTYLTKSSDIYEQAKYNVLLEPQMMALQTMFYRTNFRYFRYSFSESATKWMTLPAGSSKIFIVTDTVTLTTTRVIQYLRNHDLINKYAVLDLECVLNLPDADFDSLMGELERTKKLIIISCNGRNNNDNKLHTLVKATKGKTLIIVTINMFITDYFPCVDRVLNDNTQQFISLVPESQKELQENVKLIFQGQKANLSLIVDDVSAAFMNGRVLDKLIQEETINIGASLSNSNYEEIKHFYIERRVSRLSKRSGDTNNEKLIKSFLDITNYDEMMNDVVLVTAAPGMGKSTLLTHLSLKTKQRNWKLWIVRVNFLDYSKHFYKWYDNNTVLDSLEALSFLCKTVTRKKSISVNVVIKNGEAHLERCTGDHMDTFALNMFLHFYNNRRLILIFDGFDEICPHYKDKVVDFLSVTKTHLRKYKMWVTSRPYSDILPDLQKNLGETFTIEYISLKEQEKYLKTFWQLKLVYETLNSKQRKNLKVFLGNIAQLANDVPAWICRFCCIFYAHFRPHVCLTRRRELVIQGLNNCLRNTYDNHLKAEMYNLSGIPLLLYFVADYFVNIVDIADISSSSFLDISLHSIYEMFIENKLRKILYEDKNKMDPSNPDIMTKLEKERAENTNMYKRLAAHALLRDAVFNEVDIQEFQHMDPLNEIGEEGFNALLIKIKTGLDKTGLISHLTADNVPVFIHRSFTEYFAAGYICDILKNDDFSLKQRALWHYAILQCCTKAVLDWLLLKIEKDTKLSNVMTQLLEDEPRPLHKTEYRLVYSTWDLTKGQHIRIMTSTSADYEKDFLDNLSEYDLGIEDDPKKEHIRRQKLYKRCIRNMKPHLRKHFVRGKNSDKCIVS